MLRSLFAVILATIIGLAVAKFIEGAGVAGFDLTTPMPGAETSLSIAYQLLLVAGWGVGALVAALIALALGKKWAPLGALAAMTVFFTALMSILTFSLNWLVLPGAAAMTGLGGYISIRLLKAQWPAPQRSDAKALFDE